jgi:hypothetical protein
MGENLSRSRTAIRFMMIVNLVLWIFFVVPVLHRLVDDGFRALRRFNAEELAGRTLQVWLVGSTVLSTILFCRLIWRKASPLTLEAVLLLVWWFLAIATAAWGYMLGLGG